ncbi:MFS transporter [Cupriavidus taiwanensis]|uniref:Putative tartrate transporter n=1 Tax=Cupriavidus taiwanensis TaxID=164546 RepID=A0A7Z7NPZ1_9BURK|nr:MFS transporter [Cupriavidus taiwanensis]SOZ17452.1 putative tartrate transporter [Cupriavidus taiwanensis]SOZ96303.1 putative tartrate transporter [Cupriavidus taiwanensis]SPC25743.1 putative tartrate transporter [Cupriavidus taiwanensis]
MQKAFEEAVIRKIFWRVIPLLMVLYVVSYIDRINVGFAALTMNKDIGLTAYMFGWGAGIFFFGYCLFEVPSNLLMLRFGARRWIARILVSWGVLSCAMALVQGPTSFLVLRFLLGVAEAGFFPGVILYLTYWFPARYRARIVAIFSLAIPVSIAIGAPLSTLILELDGALGIKGWQWLFIIEGLPAVAGTFAVLRWLPDRPALASWLTSEEREWLDRQLALDAGADKAHGVTALRQAFSNPAVLVLASVYFCAIAANLGLSFFLPQIIKAQGYSTMQVGFITSLPYVAGCIGMLAIGYLSDRLSERRWFLALTMILASGGLALAGSVGTSYWSIVALSIAAVGILGCKGPFWSLPSNYVSGAAMAGGIAFINAVGNLGGFAGPFLVGSFKNEANDFSGGLFALAALAAIAALITIVFVRPKRGDTVTSVEHDTAALSNSAERRT